MSTAAIDFARTAQALAVAARAAGLSVPVFCSPPRLPGVTRSIRRRPGGSAVVAVVLRGRDAHAIARDLVEGVCVTNRLSAAAAARIRPVLLAAVGLGPTDTDVESDGAVASGDDQARMAERHTQAA